MVPDTKREETKLNEAKKGPLLGQPLVVTALKLCDLCRIMQQVAVPLALLARRQKLELNLFRSLLGIQRCVSRMTGFVGIPNHHHGFQYLCHLVGG